MNCYLISYDLNKGSKQDYNDLYRAIKNYPKWAHINESLWAVRSDNNATMIRNDLMRMIDSKDSIFVIRSGRESAWINPMCNSEWLKENL